MLLQQGKGADAGAVLGGGSNTLFGAGGATSLMVKVTTAVAVCFMVTSIFLVRGYAALLENAPVGTPVTNPGVPEEPATAPAEAPEAAAPAAPAAAAKTDGAQGTSPATSASAAAAPSEAAKTETEQKK